jgi:hypothetical protein
MSSVTQRWSSSLTPPLSGVTLVIDSGSRSARRVAGTALPLRERTRM